MIKKRSVAILALCASLTLPVQAGFEEGWIAYQRGDYATALKEWRPLAEAGNAIAQFRLGVMFEGGQGVPKDGEEAAKWYVKSANQGYALGQNKVGLMYLNGWWGMPQDYKEALRWFLLAAEQGNIYARNNLGSMFESGKGVPKDKVVAYALYSLAAACGVSDWYDVPLMRLWNELTPQEIEAGKQLAQALNKSGNFRNVLDPYPKKFSSPPSQQ